MITLAPSSAIRKAANFPIPSLPPVTIATLSVNPISLRTLLAPPIKISAIIAHQHFSAATYKSIPATSATVGTSLSPRPLKQTTMVC